MRQFTWLLLCAILAACQPGAKGVAPTEASPITGDAITTASLDAPSADAKGAAVAGMAPPTSGMVDASAVTGTAVPPPVAMDSTVQPPSDTQTDTPAAAAVGTEAADEAPTDEAPVVEEEPAPAKSADQLRCEARGGVFASAEKGGPRTCVRTTKDGGKRCDQESDCEGQCLARSQTCAPINPLMGCNDVLQDNGAKVTLCLN